jgi:hypothetical protein
MRLAFTNELIVTTRFDTETAKLADDHYSRQKPGTPQFMPPGRTIIIRDALSKIVFGWLWQQYRADKEEGYCCSIFRNVSTRLSSEIILECERIAIAKWGGATHVYIR